MQKKNKVRYAKLIVNPGAGKSTAFNKNLQAAVECLKENGIEADVALAKPKEEATRIARKAVDAGYKVIIAMGGDGTLEAALRGLVGSKTRLGIIPSGTENNIAKSLGIPEKLEDACKLIGENHVRRLDVGQARVKKGKKFYFFELTAIGLVAAVYPAAAKLLKGQLSRLKDAAETLIHQDTQSKVSMRFEDDSRVEAATMLVVVSNTPIFGKNFLVAPNASLEDGLLDVSVYPNFSKAALIAYYGAVMNGGTSDNERVQHYRVHKFELKAREKTDVMADGVMLGKGNVEIKCRAGAIRVITPKPSEASNKVAKDKDVAAHLPAPVAPASTEKPDQEKLAVPEKKES